MFNFAQNGVIQPIPLAWPVAKWHVTRTPGLLTVEEERVFALYSVWSHENPTTGENEHPLIGGIQITDYGWLATAYNTDNETHDLEIYPLLQDAVAAIQDWAEAHHPHVRQAMAAKSARFAEEKAKRGPQKSIADTMKLLKKSGEKIVTLEDPPEFFPAFEPALDKPFLPIP